MDLLLYASDSSPRLQYIVGILCQTIGIEKYKITHQQDEFSRFAGAKISYSQTAVAHDALHIQPESLLFETGVKLQTIDSCTWGDHPAFFTVETGDIPFDVLAASFYLLSRYEEYLPHQKDFYGRYAHTNSLAFKKEFIQLPLVNLWMQDLGKLLLQRFPKLILQPKIFQYTPTYDIDMAWSYFGKGAIRNTAGIIRSLLSLDLAAIRERIKVLLNFNDDPFDVYAWLDALHEKHSLLPVYFFLVAHKTGQYDKNIPLHNKFFKLLMQKLAVMYPIGVHPSWQSGDQPGLLHKEVEYLEKICGKPIVNSRQHYIRMTLPDTYRGLIEKNICNEYSMGYGSINGFRASYCMPYLWYDLLKEESTTLTVFPFCFMDANALFEQKLTPEQAYQELKHYYDVTKAVNGTLITIFHNNILSTQPVHEPWRRLYEQFLHDHF